MFVKRCFHQRAGVAIVIHMIIHCWVKNKEHLLASEKVVRDKDGRTWIVAVPMHGLPPPLLLTTQVAQLFLRLISYINNWTLPYYLNTIFRWSHKQRNYKRVNPQLLTTQVAQLFLCLISYINKWTLLYYLNTIFRWSHKWYAITNEWILSCWLLRWHSFFATYISTYNKWTLPYYLNTIFRWSHK